MNGLPLQPVLAILAGVLILLSPTLLPYVMALYLITIGFLGFIGPRRSAETMGSRQRQPVDVDR